MNGGDELDIAKSQYARNAMLSEPRVFFPSVGPGGCGADGVRFGAGGDADANVVVRSALLIRRPLLDRLLA